MLVLHVDNKEIDYLLLATCTVLVLYLTKLNKNYLNSINNIYTINFIKNNFLTHVSYSLDKKNINYKLTELLNSRYIKYTNKNNNNVNLYNNCYQEYNKPIIIKISGIWESNTSYGIIFKFIFI